MSDEPPPVRIISDRTASWEWESIPHARDAANEGLRLWRPTSPPPEPTPAAPSNQPLA
jgi:hypothetical protein